MAENRQKLALVTGASSGIGAEAAKYLARKGYRVVLVARRRTELEAVAQSIGSQAFIEVCDVGLKETTAALVERVRSTYGVPDVLVNNAGMGQWKFIEDTSPAEAEQMLQVPFLAAFYLTHFFMADMLRRKSGKIILVNSAAAMIPWPSTTGYTCARWAMRGLYESLSQDLRHTGVHCSHLVLGQVDTPYSIANPDVEKSLPQLNKIVPLLSAAKIGQVIADLAESRKSEVIYPFLLRIFVWMHRFAPKTCLWMMRVAGPKHRV